MAALVVTERVKDPSVLLQYLPFPEWGMGFISHLRSAKSKALGIASLPLLLFLSLRQK